MHYFYIFLCKDGSLYCGSTNNLERRANLHNTGRGAIYTRTHGGGEIVYSEACPTIQEAMAREREVKKWRRQKKQELIKMGLAPKEGV
jgi:putative endonuclease